MQTRVDDSGSIASGLQYTQRPVRNDFSGAPVFYTNSTSSTMDDARFFINNPDAHGTVVAAGYQTKGRGRYAERKWLSGPGENLLFTLVLDTKKIPCPVSRIPLVLGLALCRYCENEFGIRPFIKWPNDIIASGKKLSGILCESEGGFVFCGIGLNCNQQEFDSSLILPAVSLRNITGKILDIFQVLEILLGEIKKAMETDGWHHEVNSRLYKTGQKVKIVFTGDDGRTQVLAGGVLSGIDEDGALLIDTGNKMLQPVISGEIVFG